MDIHKFQSFQMFQGTANQNIWMNSKYTILDMIGRSIYMYIIVSNQLSFICCDVQYSLSYKVTHQHDQQATHCDCKVI